MLRVEELTRSFATPQGSIDVLRGVSLTLAAGESASIMGASGSGKSTFLYIVGGLDRPTSGRVLLDDVDPHTLDPVALAAFRNRQVGFVFQDHCLLPQCSVIENVLAPTIVSGTTREDIDRARSLLERVGLAGRLEHRPAELSGGEKQRAAIARALVRQPKLLLCDEPTGNLDRKTAESVASLLLELHERLQTILVIVTHNPELAARCRRPFELVDGRLVEQPASEPAVNRVTK
ncbi:MAG TPA: ABC transporter ATP-binding protein [Vicinamibacterales bacterium]